jgi:hypothetical protein
VPSNYADAESIPANSIQNKRFAKHGEESQAMKLVEDFLSTQDSLCKSCVEIEEFGRPLDGFRSLPRALLKIREVFLWF